MENLFSAVSSEKHDMHGLTGKALFVNLFIK